MGWYYARLHSHVFLYPITFGLVSTVFLTKPWIQSVNDLRGFLSNDPKRGIKIVALIVVAILLVTGISGSFGYSYFSYSHPALWSFDPDYMDEKEGIQKKLREEIEEQCKQNNRKKSEKTVEKAKEKETIEKITEKTTEKTTEKATEKTTEKTTEKIPYLQTLRKEWKNAPLSHTEVFYRIGHLAMTILFCLLFTTGFLFAPLPTIEGSDAKGIKAKVPEHCAGFLAASPEAKESKAKVPELYVWIALFFASFWVLMRATFLFEEQWMYKNPLLEVHGAFLILFVSLFGFLPFLRHQIHKNKPDGQGGNSAEKGPLRNRIFFVVTLLEGVVVAVLELGSGDVSPQIENILVYTFGTGSSILSYLSMFTVILVFALPFLLQHLRKESSEVDKNTQGCFMRIKKKFMNLVR